MVPRGLVHGPRRCSHRYTDEVVQQMRATRAFSWDTFLDTYLPALVFALGTGIALPAVPTLARSFHVSFGVASGVLTAFLLGGTIGTIPTGWLIDRFGRRR